MNPSSRNMEQPRHIPWEEYSRLCRILARRISEDHKPDTVVGIAHGGVIVGATIATILGRDFFPIKLSRRVNARVVRKRAKMLVPPTADLGEKLVLLVDDASRSGETLKAAIRSIKGHKPRKIITAVLVRSGEYAPDYYASYFAGDVRFPWQLEETPESGEDTYDKNRKTENNTGEGKKK
ncbi:MAG: phosphoribosyltransferase family protein [bacterium]